ncbi:MAG: chemotaxis-specific protein-glutamate methyltransferase CheB [Rikenellaceae bacterium]
MKKIKVLIVEDSLVSQKLLKRILETDPDFEVVAIAENGFQAIEYAESYKPDVISMDINMPLMDGLEATRQIMSSNPLPIVIVSSNSKSQDIDFTIKELEAGALTVLYKPSGPGDPDFLKFSGKFRRTLKLMSEIKVVKKNYPEEGFQKITQTNANSETLISNIPKKSRIVAIGASAGGPEALRKIFNRINPNFPLPVLIVQHIDHNFSAGFANWLNTYSTIPVKLAENGETIKKGNVYLSPGGSHLMVNPDGTISLNDELADSVHKPSIDLLFKSVGRFYGNGTIAILLSGMGRDGAVELKKLKDIGAITFAQDEKSSLVYGMPGEAVKIGGVCRIMSPDEIVDELNKLY